MVLIDFVFGLHFLLLYDKFVTGKFVKSYLLLAF